jgi:RNA polymerase sigma-70 factor (ECF subfamily)
MSSALAPILCPMERVFGREVVRAPSATPLLDPESRDWLDRLRGDGAVREEAVQRLHALLLRAARFETGRRRASHPHLRGDLDDIAQEAAADALLAVLRRLDDFRGLSRFTTWAYKFAVHHASVAVRRRAWQGRELPVEEDASGVLASPRHEPEEELQRRELLDAIRVGIAEALTAHQRTVLVALALNEVPIDVLAERMDTTRGALYKTLHDARRKLRRHLAESERARSEQTKEVW